LSSKDELNLMYANLRAFGIGNFDSDYYWSSTQSSDNFAWNQSFNSGGQESSGKIYPCHVRAVRAF
jgi:hypothetical protein